MNDLNMLTAIPAAKPRSSRVRPARLLCRLGWVAAVAVPLIPLTALRTYEDRLQHFAGAGRPYQLLALGLFVLFALPTLHEETRPMRPKSHSRTTRSSTWLTAVVVLALASTLWSTSPLETALDATAIASTVAVIWLVVSSGRIDGVFLLRSASASAAIALCVLALTLDFSGRTFGQVPANQIGKLCLLVIFGAFLWNNTAIRLALVGAGLGVLVMAESRGSLLALGLAGLVVLLNTASRTLRRRVLYVTLALITGGASTGIVVDGAFSGAEQTVDGLFQLSSVERGLLTGGSGRLETWRIGIEIAAERPVLGHGFGTSGHLAQDHGAEVIHSGLIAAAVELGLVGLLLFVMAFLTAIVALLRRSGERGLGQVDSNLLLAGFLVSGLVLTVFEPNYLAVGFAYWLTTTAVCLEGMNPQFIGSANRPAEDQDLIIYLP